MRRGLIVGLHRHGDGGDALVYPAPVSQIKAVFDAICKDADSDKYDYIELWTRDGVSKRKKLKSELHQTPEAEQPEPIEEVQIDQETIPEVEPEPEAPKRRGRPRLSQD